MNRVNQTGPKQKGNEKEIDLIFKDKTYAIIGAAMEVHQELGPGFLEAVYQEALEEEFTCRHIPFIAQKELPIRYKGHFLRKLYVVDFIVYEQVLVEIKALDYITTIEEAQLLNYLKASQYPLGLLLNFGAPSLQWKRRIFNPSVQNNPSNP